MTRNLKALGLALMATFVMNAAITSAAQADGTLTADEYPVEILGFQAIEHRLTIETGIFVECPTVDFEGTLSQDSSTLTLEPKYEGTCKITNPITLHAEVTENGCHYLFHMGGTVSSDYSGTFDLTCPPGLSMVVEAGTCLWEYEPQNGIGPITFTNRPAPDSDVTVEPKVSSTMSYNKTKDGFLCPLDGTGKKTDGSFTGRSLIHGLDEDFPPGPVGIQVSD